MDKKTYYSKNHSDCPCCGWQGHVKHNTREWLGRKDIFKNLNKYLEQLKEEEKEDWGNPIAF